jgi:hypothetical protein
VREQAERRVRKARVRNDREACISRKHARVRLREGRPRSAVPRVQHACTHAAIDHGTNEEAAQVAER